MRFSTSAIILLSISLESFAQTGDYRMGGRSMGIGFTSVTLTDEWSPFHNIGALAGKDNQPYAGFAYQSLYAVEGLGKSAATIIWPAGKLCGSLNFFRFGDSWFNETRVGLGLSHRIRFVSLGVQLNYTQFWIENFGSRGIFFVDAGGLAELFKGFWVGAFIQNINRSELSEITHVKFPVTMRLGISYRPQEFLMLNIEIEKISDALPCLEAGLEYSVHKKLCLRTGVNTSPVRNFFGIGFSPWRFKIDYALSVRNPLGISHQFSICYLLHMKK